MPLIIVESPTKAKTLSKFLGRDYVLLATLGHVKDLPKSKLSIEIEDNFKPNYEPVAKRADIIKEIIASAKKADRVLLATDPDREGEAIAQHVWELLGSKAKATRIVFHEITKEAVEEAIKHPREVDLNLVNAQIARRVLDRLVGYKLSPLLWRKVRRGLSAGRVQTVAVRLICERERDIAAFKPEEYWEIRCRVKPALGKNKTGEFEVLLVRVNQKKLEIKDGKTAEKIVADLKRAEYQVAAVKQRQVVKHPYPPFTTSTMTQAAARLFGWSAKRTMRVAQRLYEEGLITYHRTDSLNLAQTAVVKARSYLEKHFGAAYLPAKPRFYKTASKSAQEAHEAIRPTTITTKPGDKTRSLGDGKKLYELIWKRFLACQMAAAVYDETVIDVAARRVDNETVYGLRASGQVMKFDGWKVLFTKSELESPLLPKVSQGETLALIEVMPQQKFTQALPRFSEASLIKTLEKLGIGRPSTYAPIISTIQVRQYVEKKDGRFFATPVGMAVNDFLIPNFPTTFEYGFTAQMEEGLDKIALGEKDWQKEIKAFYQPFSKLLTQVEKTAKRVKIETEKLGRQCPECKKGELVIRIGRFGKFISCDKFPDCKHTEKYIEKINVKCPECKQGEVIIKKSGRGRTFFGCSRYPDCKWASWRKPEIVEK